MCETARPAPFPSPVPPWVPTRARGSREGRAGSGAGQLPRSASPGARVPSPPWKIPGNTRLVLEMPRNPPVNSCRSSAPSPELRGPPPTRRGLRADVSISGARMEAQRGARAEGIDPEQAHLGTARSPVPPDPTDAPRPGHALPPWQPRGPLSPGTRAAQRDLAASFPCKTRLLSLCGKSAASGGVVFPFSHPRAAPGWPWAELLGKRRSTRGSRPGRAPAPRAGSLAATRLDPGAPRSFLALLPSSTVINLSWKRHSLKQVQAARAGGRRGMLGRRDTGGIRGSRGGCEALPARPAHLAPGLC